MSRRPPWKRRSKSKVEYLLWFHANHHHNCLSNHWKGVERYSKSFSAEKTSFLRDQQSFCMGFLLIKNLKVDWVHRSIAVRFGIEIFFLKCENVNIFETVRTGQNLWQNMSHQSWTNIPYDLKNLQSQNIVEMSSSQISENSLRQLMTESTAVLFLFMIYTKLRWRSSGSKERINEAN